MEFSLENLCVVIQAQRVKKINTVSSDIQATKEIFKKEK